MAEWDGSILIWPRRYLFVGVGDKSVIHKTHATIVCLALDAGKSFKLRIAGAHGEKSYQAAIIAPDVEHSKYCREAGVIILLYLMPETDEAHMIGSKYLKSNPIAEVPPGVLKDLLPQLSRYHLDTYRGIRDLACDNAEGLCDNVISALGISPSTKLSAGLALYIKDAIRVLDDKIRQGASASELRVEKIADEVGYKHNLGTKFVEQVKVSMRHYAVGLRLREAVKELRKGDNIDESIKKVYRTGSAFSNDFYAWFGIRPINIKNKDNPPKSCEE